MTQITINIGDAKMPRVVEALKAQYNYTGYYPPLGRDQDPATGTAETEQQFVRRVVKTWLKETTRAYEIAAAARTAQEEADNLGDL